VLSLETPNVLRVAGFACLILSKIIIKNAIKPAILKICPAEAIECHPPRDAG